MVQCSGLNCHEDHQCSEITRATGGGGPHMMPKIKVWPFYVKVMHPERLSQIFSFVLFCSIHLPRAYAWKLWFQKVWGRNLYIFKIFWNLFKRQVLYKQLVMDIRKGILCRVSQISSIHHKEIFLDLFLKERLWAAPGYSLLALSLRLTPHSWQAFGNYR